MTPISARYQCWFDETLLSGATQFRPDTNAALYMCSCTFGLIDFATERLRSDANAVCGLFGARVDPLSADTNAVWPLCCFT